MELCYEGNTNPMPNEDWLLEELKRRSNYTGKTTAQWIQNELCISILVETNDYVSILRKHRQNYLFNAFNKEYYQKNKSIFVMDKLLPRLVSWDSDCHTLVFWDEFKAFDADKDWIPMIEHVLKKLDIFIAVEPLSWPKFEEQKTSIGSNCMIRLLPTKHRTCKLIDQFVSATIRDKGDLQIESDHGAAAQLDYHLEDRHFVLPPGYRPIWINANDSSFEQLKSTLEMLTKESEEILAISKFQSQKFMELCIQMKWKFANSHDIIGYETSCLITFGISAIQNLEELVSRARNKLIIVTTDDTRFVTDLMNHSP